MRRYAAQTAPFTAPAQVFQVSTRVAPRSQRPVVPPPKPPPRMVEEVRPPKALRGLIGRLFRGRLSPQSSEPHKPFTPPRPLSNIGLSAHAMAPKFLNTDHATPILYWYCVDLSFVHTDFERLLPHKSIRVGSGNPANDTIKFDLVRARNPVNLTRWMGYFLRFESTEQAMIYYQETLGAELCGMPLKLRFVAESIRGLHSNHFDKMPQLPRANHALVLGLPHGYTETQIIRSLWDYDLIDDDKLAVERLPVDKIKYGGSPFLLRFQTAAEADRFVRDHHNGVFPYSDARVFCEVVD